MSTAAATAPVSDERVRTTNVLIRSLRRPEMGAAIAALVIFVLFSTITRSFLTGPGVSTWLYSASLYGIMAVAVAMLMIGGEFDLSAGAMTGTTGLMTGVFTTQWGLNVWVALLVSLGVALLIGALNGWMVMRTGLPSFIVTLGTFFILQGINLAVTKLITGQVAIQGMADVPSFNAVRAILGGDLDFGGFRLKTAVLWWVLLTAIASWVLMRSRFGNWVFAVGGAQASARQVGVPVMRTKLALFMTTAGAAWLVGTLGLFDVGTVQATSGIGDEFVYIICAVVGGCLLTGGFGSAIGAAVGALIYGMALQGIVFAQWDNNWLKAFLGGMLLLAVLINLTVQRRAGGRA